MKRLFILVFLFSFAGSSSFAVLPVTDGLVMHLDADSISGLSNGQAVSVWTDLSGTGHNATLAAGNATFVTAVLNGKPVVHFDQTNTYFTFNEISTIRTVLWVLKEDAAASFNRFLLGHSTSYDFHRGHYYFWDATWANAKIRNGVTRLNGSVIDGTVTEVPYDNFCVASLVTTGNVAANQLTRDRSNTAASWFGDIAEVIIYNRDLSDIEENQVGYYLASKYGISTAYTSYTPPYAATPNPAQEDGGIPTTGATLTWTVVNGTAPTSNVWFGPQGAMTQVATGLSVNSYSIPTTLNPDQVYEWRIDVVDGGQTLEGVVWSFRTLLAATKVLDWDLSSTYTEPAGHQQFITNVTAMASSEDWGSAAGTLSDHGLYGLQHIVYPYGYSWISANGGGTGAHPADSSTTGWGAWIAYQFDAVYALGTLYIWNQNQIYFNDLTNRGLKNVTIQYSTDGLAWTSLGSYVVLKATGQNGMMPSLTVNFAGASARYVVITAAATEGQWGADPGSSDIYYALAKVRFGIQGTTAMNIKTPDSANYGTLDADGFVKGVPQIADGLSASDDCMNFAGDADTIVSSVLTSDFPAAGTQQWSMSFYVYLDEALSDYDMLAGIGSPLGFPDGTVRYIINYGNQIYFWGNNAYDLGSGVPFDIAQWQMITVTYDGINLKLYKNSDLIGSKKLSAFEDAVPAIHLAVKNMAGNGNTGKFNGKINNFRVYRGVLVQSDIDALAALLPLTGNFNRDAVVDMADFSVLAQRWLTNTVIPQWPSLILFDMEGANALDSWSVDSGWNAGIATISLIQGDAANPSDPNQPFAGAQAVRMTYDNSSGSNVWSSVDVSLPTTIDMTQYDLLRFHLKRHVGNSHEDQMFFRGYSPEGTELFSISETTYSTDTPAGVWPDDQNTGSVVIWSNQIPFAHRIKTLKIGTYSWSKVGGTGTIDIDNIQLEKFDNCIGTILEGDFNANCVIDMNDFAVFAGSWLEME